MKYGLSSTSRYLRPSVLGATACGLLFVACSSASDDGPVAPEDSLPETGTIELQLNRAASCDDLLVQVQDSILGQLAERAKELRTRQDANYGGTGGYGGIGVGVTTPGSVAPDAPVSPNGDPGSPTPPKDADGSAGGSAGSAGSGGTSASGGPTGEGQTDNSGEAPPVAQPQPGFSGTTVQVKDVDEADIVKAEGDYIYLLHGGSLFVLQGWPANATAIVASTVIEGEPSEMFVRDGKALVFSRVYQQLAADTGGKPLSPYGDYGSSNYTKLTVFDVAATTPSVVRESYIEGDYVSARRHDGLVRAVVQDGFKVPPLGNPAIEYYDLFGEPFPQEDIDAQVDAWLARTIRSVRSTDLGDWLPREFVRKDGQLVAEAPRCADYYSPDPGLTQSGVTSVVSLDLDDATGPLGGATILGHAERVYSNDDVLLVTQSDYRFNVEVGAQEQTIIHRFDIDGPSTSYTASGAVAGSIQNQFSLDERDGVIRVSTTEQRFNNGGPPIFIAPTMPAVGVAGTGSGGATGAVAPGPSGSAAATSSAAPGAAGTGGAASSADPSVGGTAGATNATDLEAPAPPPDQPNGPINRIVTLETEGAALVQLGSTDDFGASEQIYATRFIGDRGYVVTFRRTDPLFVVDLADPAHPSVVGELHIPGFSDYLYPLDDNHLFAIGQDADANGAVQGLALQIFDVTDAANPTLSQRYVYADQGFSPANIDHRAITFHPDRNVVAFPYQNYNTGESTLEIFDVSAQSGFVRLGGMGMTDTLSVEQCLESYYGYDPRAVPDQSDPEWEAQILTQCRWNQHFRRGLFRDNFVYGIGNTGVFAYDLDELAAGPVGEVSLPAEVYDYGNYPVQGAGGGMATTSPPPATNIGGTAGAGMPQSGGSASAGSAGGAGGTSAASMGGQAGDKAE